ncbi:MAG: type II secretion system F family protein [Candidatus Aenigmarchaeota archaeon]|nr:type II secretion system F family protein [Candidatus Aenigmarchaeota archaeon]
MKTELKLIIAGFCFVVLVVLLSIVFSLGLAITINALVLGIFMLAVPYIVYRFFKFQKIKSYERDFPKFLRDLAESKRAGLSVNEAIKTAGRSEYGSLTPVLQKLNTQLSWNVPLEQVLEKFAALMSESTVITNSILIIQQANKAGGSVEKTLESLAENIESLHEVEEEKKTLLNQQVVMTYAIFFIFLGITISLIKFLVPLLQTHTEFGGFSLESLQTSPCEQCFTSRDVVCSSCIFLTSVADNFGFGQQNDPVAYYKALFFVMILIQAIFTGLIAGQISADSVVAGLKHSFVMFLFGFIIFLAVVRLGVV